MNLTYCIGFTQQGISSRGGAGVASVRKDQELHPCWTQLVPSSSKMDPLQDTAEPVNDADGTSVTTYLGKGEKCCTEL